MDCNILDNFKWWLGLGWRVAVDMEGRDGFGLVSGVPRATDILQGLFVCCSMLAGVRGEQKPSLKEIRMNRYINMDHFIYNASK